MEHAPGAGVMTGGDERLFRVRSRNSALRRLSFAALIVGGVWAAGGSPRADDKAVFTLVFRGVATTYDTAAAFVLPGERVPIEARGRRGATYAVRVKDGVLTPTGGNKWNWTAPQETGVQKLEIIDVSPDRDEKPSRPVASKNDGHETVRLNAFVMVPASRVRHGVLNGYRIGEYPPLLLKQNPVYRAPRGFVEVTRDSQDTKVSPHFKIGQFVCKQPDPFPKYLVLDERLPIKLEGVIDRLRALGHDVDSLTVMSGYRTPFYNKALGNVQFSMHQFGGAADVYVDEDRNGNMDDLNADRHVDKRDAVQLFEIADRMSRERGYLLQGGLGYYPATRAHGPFVHMDIRGTAARWAE